MEKILSESKKYESIAEKRSTSYASIEKALRIVKDFILKKDRIIYGGMAIDLSLKLSGHEGIYAADVVPDYDFMSPDHYNDSNELAVILADAGFENVSAIHAIHLTTRKVRVNFVPVADITFIPQNIYDNIPTLTIIGVENMDNIRIVHPDFQRLDIHRAFSNLFEKPPGEVILQRSKKDMKRFRMINKQYPIYNDEAEKTINKLKESAEKVKTILVKIEKKYLQNTAIGGFFAYGLLYKFWKDMQIAKGGKESKEKEESEENSAPIPLDCEIQKDDICLHWPNSWDITPTINIITDHFENLLKSIKKDYGKNGETYYNKYLDDLRPRTVQYMDFEIFDNFGRQTSAVNLMKLLNYWKIKDAKSEKTQNIWLCEGQYILTYFLLKHFEDKKNADFYLAFYNSTMIMIHDLENVMEIKEVKPNMIPHFLTASTYGEANMSSDYVNSVREKMAMLAGERVSYRGPFGFYPKKDDESSKEWEQLETSENELFAIDGKKRNSPFIPVMDLFG
jgi:hypothetical protein